MASRPQGYGLSRELALKTAGKYSDSDEVSKQKKNVTNYTLTFSVGNYCLVPNFGYFERARGAGYGRLPRVAQIRSHTVRINE